MQLLALSFVRTDIHASRDDVERFGPEEAAEYWADLARSQDYWDRLDTTEGREALRRVANEMAEEIAADA